MKAYVGIDLHSTNSYIGIIDQEKEKLFGKRFSNNPDDILNALDPFKKDIVGIVVESTYNWYWLVDTLEEDGYKVHLANPAAMTQYEGIKHTDDAWDSFWLADMLRLNLLKEGYIYPKETRGLRDLLRRRLLFVRQRTAQILSLQSTITRHLGIKFSVGQINKLKPEDAHDLFNCYEVALIAKNNIKAIAYLSQIIKNIEQETLSKVKLTEEFQKLTTIPGIGEILGVTIMLEVGDSTLPLSLFAVSHKLSSKLFVFEFFVLSDIFSRFYLNMIIVCEIFLFKEIVRKEKTVNLFNRVSAYERCKEFTKSKHHHDCRCLQEEFHFLKYKIQV